MALVAEGRVIGGEKLSTLRRWWGTLWRWITLRWLPDRASRVAMLLLGLLIASALPVWWVWGGNAVLVVAGLVYAGLTTWTNLEAREGRLTRDRPFVFVDFVERTERGGSPGATLRIRNEGRAPATDVRVVPDVRLLDRGGADLLENPVLRDGVPFLAPGVSMSIDLHEGTILGRYYDDAPRVEAGAERPPERTLRVACRADYRDGITGRRYSEAFTAVLDARQHGWTVIGT